MVKPVEMIGKKFGRLTVVKRDGHIQKLIAWLCKCECGKELTVVGKNLRNGNTKSCGCLSRDLLLTRNAEMATHGMTRSPEFAVWDNMKQRCLNPNHKSYERYGARGIEVCERWINSFENFFADMGPRPPNMTLDRIDNDKGYEPGNCRWATSEVQANNRETSRLIAFKGKEQSASQWSREYDIPPKTLLYRLNNGWGIEEALTTKVNYGNGWSRGVRT